MTDPRGVRYSRKVWCNSYSTVAPESRHRRARDGIGVPRATGRTMPGGAVPYRIFRVANWLGIPRGIDPLRTKADRAWPTGQRILPMNLCEYLFKGMEKRKQD